MTKLQEVRSKIINSFKGLRFDEESHTYMLNNKKLLSTTKYISKFYEEFNAWWPSEAKAKKILQENPDDYRTGQYYRKRWELIGNEASSMGTRIHMFAECYPNFDEPMCNGEQGVVDFFEWIPDHYELLFQELRVYDEETGRAGTIDGLLLNTKTNKLVIFDFKTNRRNILEYYSGKKLKEPFKQLYSNNISKYALQLSDYTWMIEKNTEFEIEERWVIWLRDKPVLEKCKDRNDTYVIQDIKPSVNKKYFKLFKTKDYSSELLIDLKTNVPSRKKTRKKN